MEKQNIQGIPLKIFSDKLMKVSYVSFLTNDTLLSAKLPTIINNYKLGHFIQPNYLLDIELIKTRKNWIVRGIHKYEKIAELKDYKDYTTHSKIINLIYKYIKEDQGVNIMNFIIKTLQVKKISKIDTKLFESRLLKELGFIPHIENDEKFAAKLHIAKDKGDLLQVK